MLNTIQYDQPPRSNNDGFVAASPTLFALYVMLQTNFYNLYSQGMIILAKFFKLYQGGVFMLTELNSENFNEMTEKGVKLIEFYTQWCGYCKKQLPELEQMDKIWIGQVDADNAPAIAAKFNINAFPSFLIMKDGEVAEHFSGMHKKEDLMAKIMKHV